MNFLFAVFALLAIFAVGAMAVYPYTKVEISFYPANSNCNASKKPPQANVTYVLNQCYNGYMYDCDPYGGISYTIYGQEDCYASYPKSYGLPSFMCLSPVYDYSKYDSYFYCY